MALMLLCCGPKLIILGTYQLFLSKFIYFWNLFKLSLNLQQNLEPIEIIGTYFDSLTLLEDQSVLQSFNPATTIGTGGM